MKTKSIFPLCKVVLLGIIVMFLNIDVIAIEKSELVQLADSNNVFALDLYHQLKNKEGKLFFSPYRISTALAMTYGGARGNTEKQMAKVMHFSLEQKKLHTESERSITETIWQIWFNVTPR